MMAAESSFADANILVYNSTPESPFYETARTALEDCERRGMELWISRQVLREYLSTMTRQVTVGRLQVPFWPDIVADLSRRFRVADETEAVTSQLVELLGNVPCAGRQVHDANIVATMITHGIPRLLTNNVADFVRFRRWIEVIPLVR